MTGADTTRLAIAAGAAVRRLRRGDAVVGAFRADLIALLTGMVVVGAGRTASPAIATNPAELVDLVIDLCRASGMSGLDMAAHFNAAVERRPR
ncbi:hypothetical protein [Azospirillum picis]|uniref:Uncharacterized protein n=1 Tax=Azospirillum picis TaxID=488438 RepID=A0ABU0MNR9_9PROT|nr:hypothetical protein [Azospirillum picis]MBP2301287.1 hypothetical protein [Azospirillum picis]MDQ0535118.1 hypothetical protein [Azospirillum picis]